MKQGAQGAGGIADPWSELKVLPTDPASRDAFNTQHDFVIPVTGSLQWGGSVFTVGGRQRGSPGHLRRGPQRRH